MMATLLLWRIGILLLCQTLTHQFSLPSSNSYIGAVVEYTPITNSDDKYKLWDLNADNYLKFIEKASNYSVDIIVFPESSLSLSSSKNNTISRSEAATYIPDPNASIVPCDNNQSEKYSSSLKKLSCAAKSYRMYVVINHREKVDCVKGSQGCPDDGLLIYNSHVVFDRNGRVIARYRKYNLFGEPGTNITNKPEASIFTTDFGVTFGHFICFDVLFEQPAVNLTRDIGVTDIVYSAHWYSELPYAYGLEVQAAWAYANDVNFLAAGRNNPKTGSGGSGIFLGRQGHVHVVSEIKASNILVIAEIPKKIKGERRLMDNTDLNKKLLKIYRFNKTEISTSDDSLEIKEPVYRTTNLSNYTSKLINPRGGNYIENICNNELCCEFRMKVEFNESLVVPGVDYYRYRMIAFNGTMSFAGKGSGHTKICAVVACLNDTLDSCGKMFKSETKLVVPTIFHSLNISISKIKNERSLYLPISLASDLKPLNVSEFSFMKINESTYDLGLLKPRNDSLSFGIVCHLYGVNRSASLSIFSLLTIIIIGLVGRMIS